MGKILQALGLQEAAVDKERTILSAQVDGLRRELTESLAQLELARDNAGYMLLNQQYADEFTRDGLEKAANQGRLFGVANPLIKRGREIRHAYIWGQGLDIQAANPEVNELIQSLMDDDGNREAFFGAQAQQIYEGTLYDEGNYFITCFTNPLTGRVQIRTLPFAEMRDKITAPGDKATTWFHLRRWTEVNETTGERETKEAYYPDIKFSPATRYKRINGVEVLWDAPVRHVKVNAGQAWKYGIGDSYAAIPWALSHKGFLEDWALLMKALAKIAYVTSSKNAGQAQAKRASLRGLGEAPAGSTLNLTDDQKLEPVSKSGATLDAESSRPLATMAASAVGLPVTILLADPGQTGARATAETLDMPTRLIMQARQQLHTEVLKDVLGYAVEQAVLAPRGPLRGLGKAMQDGDRRTVQFTEPEDRTVTVTWPGLDEVDVKTIMDAIVAADGLADVPKLPLVRLALQILGVADIDELIDEITDDEGNLIAADTNAGDVAARAFRNGDSPSEALR